MRGARGRGARVGAEPVTRAGPGSEYRLCSQAGVSLMKIGTQVSCHSERAASRQLSGRPELLTDLAAGQAPAASGA